MIKTTHSTHLRFVGAVGGGSGLGALHFPNCLRGLQGHILRPHSVPRGRTAEQLFWGFARRCVGILTQVIRVIRVIMGHINNLEIQYSGG